MESPRRTNLKGEEKKISQNPVQSEKMAGKNSASDYGTTELLKGGLGSGEVFPPFSAAQVTTFREKRASIM
jgi:hypothetical protein